MTNANEPLRVEDVVVVDRIGRHGLIRVWTNRAPKDGAELASFRRHALDWNAKAEGGGDAWSVEVIFDDVLGRAPDSDFQHADYAVLDEKGRKVVDTLNADFNFNRDERREFCERIVRDHNAAQATRPTREEATAEKREEGAGVLHPDTARLNAIAREYWDVRSFTMPTPGGDDDDVGWRVIGHHIAPPHERDVSVVYTDDPRAAIDAALRESAKGGGA